MGGKGVNTLLFPDVPLPFLDSHTTSQYKRITRATQKDGLSWTHTTILTYPFVHIPLICTNNDISCLF